MKTPWLFPAALVMLIPAALQSQETTDKTWRIAPELLFIKDFPGATLEAPPSDFRSQYRYEGVGLAFKVRCTNINLPFLAVTFGAGANWYYDSEPPPVDGVVPAVPFITEGLGQTFYRGDFNTFPITLGAQAVYPFDKPELMMFFLGVEGSANLVSGYIGTGDQFKPGYSIVGGFAVRAFEFGVHYASFSDMRNLGVHFGIRLNPFSI